jgi:hypothetical protein
VEQIQQRFEEKIARSTELRQQHLASIVQVCALLPDVLTCTVVHAFTCQMQSAHCMCTHFRHTVCIHVRCNQCADSS